MGGGGGEGLKDIRNSTIAAPSPLPPPPSREASDCVQDAVARWGEEAGARRLWIKPSLPRRGREEGGREMDQEEGADGREYQAMQGTF